MSYAGLRALGIGPRRTLSARDALSARRQIILATFENHSADTTLGATLTEAFRVDLSQSPVVRLVSAQTIVDALGRMQKPSQSTLTPELARNVAEREGITAVVQGEIGRAGTGYVLTASVVSPHDGAVLVAVRQTARNDGDLIPALDRLSRALRERIGESIPTIRASPPLEHVTTASLEALRKYTQALHLDAISAYEEEIPLLREATALDTGFAMAWRKLAVRLARVGGPNEQVVAAATQAYTHRERLPDLERRLATASYFELVDYQPARALAADRAALDLDPDNNLALSDLAILLERQRRYAAAESLSLRGVQLGQRGSISANLIVERALQGRGAAADSAIAELARSSPSAPLPLAMEALRAAARHDYATAMRIVKQLREEQAASPIWAGRADHMLADFGAIQGQVALSARLFQAAAEEGGGLTQDRLVAAACAGWLDLRYRHQRSDALARMDTALSRYPLSTLAPMDRPYTVLARFFAEAGHVAEAHRLIDEFERTVPAGLRRGDTTFYGATGAIALAEGRTADAIAAFHAWYDSSGCETCGLYEVAVAFERAGQPDSALVYYQRLADTPGMFRVNDDAFTLPLTYLRMGELYDARGDRAKAVDVYTRFVRLWANADPELQPAVRSTRARLEKLESDGAIQGASANR
ncbi:MAG: tetratricopeptide repeat protein [Gemmatimonadaceae bacterium]